MALNYADRIAVRNNIIDRCTGIVVNLALFIRGESGGTANHANRLFWAKGALASPRNVGDAVSWYVLDQPDYISDGSGIDDDTLKGAVETAINTQFIEAA